MQLGTVDELPCFIAKRGEVLVVSRNGGELFEGAGEAAIAIALKEKQYFEPDEQQLRIKILAMGLPPRTAAVAARGSARAAQGKTDPAGQQKRLAEGYRRKRIRVEPKQAAAAEEPINIAALYATAAADLKMVPERLGLTKPTGGPEDGQRDQKSYCKTIKFFETLKSFGQTWPASIGIFTSMKANQVSKIG